MALPQNNDSPFEKLGLVCKPTGSAWSQSHCLGPFVQQLSESLYRIHFACRDAKNRSRGGWAEFEASDRELSLLRFAPGPSIDIGRLGAFDDAGVVPGCLVSHEDRLLMYYTGWTLGGTVPFQFFVGLAFSADGGETFQRMSEAPVLGRNKHDPFLAGAPWVLKEGNLFRMWYASATEWIPDPDGAPKPIHYYTIKHAVSEDGINWQTNDHLCLPYLDGEHALARPVVVRHNGGYRMIYSARRLGETYRIHTATSVDGINWQRTTEELVDVSPSGWDSEMVCYGNFLKHRDTTFLLYNGNAYGRDGFGAARLRGPSQ